MILALSLAFLNMLAGRGLFKHDKFICRTVGMPLVVSLYFGNWWLVLPIFAGFALWSVRGWGKYFSAYHGRDNPNEYEIEWIDALGYKLYPIGDNYARGRLCMGLRGMFLYPLFMALAFLNPYAPLVGIGMFLQGWCYGICRYIPEKYAGAVSEINTGLLIGVLIWVV